MDGRGDNVGNCLRLARAWRTLNNEVAALEHFRNDYGLGTVCVDDVDRFRNVYMLVDRFVIRN